MVQFLERAVYLLSVPAVCLAEVLTLMWLYGVQRLANRISDMTGKSESFLWKWMWKFLCPTVLTVSSCSLATRRVFHPACMRAYVCTSASYMFVCVSSGMQRGSF